jgi:hypothetical protein
MPIPMTTSAVAVTMAMAKAFTSKGYFGRGACPAEGGEVVKTRYRLVVESQLVRFPWCRGELPHHCPHAGRPPSNNLLARLRHSPLTSCQCECHTGCPVSSIANLTEDEWLARCTCPGSAHRRHVHTALRDFDWTTDRSEARLRADVRQAFRREGEEATDHEINMVVKARDVKNGSGPMKIVRSGELIKAAIQPVRDLFKELGAETDEDE